MTDGSKLVILGTLLGALCLALFLYAVTGSLSAPQTAFAAGEDPAAQATAASEDVNPAPEAEIGRAVDLDPGAGQEGCALSASFPAAIQQWCSLITHYALKRGLTPDLVASVIYQESGGDPDAYSKSGAVGLMQVMPSDGLAAAFMCANGPCFTDRPSTADLQNPEFNISYGTKMLAALLAKHGDIRDALRSYGPMDVGYYYADIVLGILQNHQGE